MRTALRRHHRERKLAKRKITHVWARGNPRLLGIYTDTPCSCSCYGCRNPRFYEGPTVQERRQVAWLEVIDG